jgi:hypothetical protein
VTSCLLPVWRGETIRVIGGGGGVNSLAVEVHVLHMTPTRVLGRVAIANPGCLHARCIRAWSSGFAPA